ncbi:tRNA 2-thiocytidine biosynthesis TtcA family protein [Calderihabitans maritimus]|uniref:PP-loop domain protein n=1 Tax=Calderihabitans maritimus TaxID=1246530 RepID=A0A1Z5HNK0_9FIRM|nr:tRNA 2-thiocytidine biosynthesis TtcA family protein [Calderihabitans maritimus]GAW90957.1 PP-loop domain protein [Calderihabitans maritimus]
MKKRILPKNYVRKLWRTAVEFKLLQPGDRVLVGFSGGKDSSFLLYALKILQHNFPFSFELGAIHVDMGFEKDSDPSPLEEFCRELGVPFHLQPSRIAQIVFRENNGQNPCSICAHLRRGIINDYAVKKDYNKVALAHHYDDAVETFLMSQLYSGQLRTFSPKTYLDRTGLTVIRPLCYFRESEIKGAFRFINYRPVASPCPLNGRTKRQEVKELIRSLLKKNKLVFDNLASAMREGNHIELWPSKLSREEMKKNYREFQSNHSPESDFSRE